MRVFFLCDRNLCFSVTSSTPTNLVWMTLTHFTLYCAVVRRMVSRVKIKMVRNIFLESKRNHNVLRESTLHGSTWVNRSCQSWIGTMPVHSTDIYGKEKERVLRFCSFQHCDLLHFLWYWTRTCHVHRCPVLSSLRTRTEWEIWGTRRTYKPLCNKFSPPPVQACMSPFRRLLT